MSAADYFAKNEAGRRTMQEAHLATEIAYSTIHKLAKGGSISAPLAQALQQWSLKFAPDCGAYISAARTLGIAEPTPVDIRKAAGE